MKKQFLFLFVLVAFISCSDDVKFNNPAFEGQKDNVFWRAVDARAAVGSDGSLTIDGYTRDEKLTLRTVSKFPKTYFLGTGNSNKVTYVLTGKAGTITFATGFGVGEGQIIIEEFDAVNNTVTGTFKFNAENIYDNPLAEPVLNFQYGHFYKIPVPALLN